LDILVGQDEKNDKYKLTRGTDAVLDEVLQLLLGKDEDRKRFETILNSLPSSDQRMVLSVSLKTISGRYLSGAVVSDDSEWWEADASLVSAAAGYLNLVVKDDDSRKSQLIDWLTSVSGAGTGEGIGIRRAAVAVLSRSKYDAETVLEKSLQQFGDPLYIRHAPSLQQEGNLAISWSFHRAKFVQSTPKFSSFLQAMCKG
jgi:telomere length regulation protein